MLDVMAITKSAISVSQAALRLSSGHPRYSRRQLLANAAMAASRVATSLRQPRQGMFQRRKDTDRHPLRFCVRALLFGCYLDPRAALLTQHADKIVDFDVGKFHSANSRRIYSLRQLFANAAIAASRVAS
jgi:hypothetical protein